MNQAPIIPTMFARLALRVFDDCLLALHAVHRLPAGMTPPLNPAALLEQSGSPTLALLWNVFDQRVRWLLPTDPGTPDDVTMALALREAIYSWAADRLRGLN